MSYNPEELRNLIGNIPQDSDYRPKLIKKYESMVLGKGGDDLTSLTLCAGLIPNENSVVLLQDSLGIIPRTGQQRSLETKIRDINRHAFFGIAGDPYFANELSEIHGSAILLLENIENLSPLHQDGTLLPFMKWGEIPSGQTKDFVSMINHKKLKIIGTQTQLKKGEESSLSPRLGGVCTYPFYEKEI